MKIILASQNQGKLAEFNQLAKSTKISFVSPPEGSIFPQETGNTFSANALIKAKYIFSLTGQPSLGDDSGLEVDALNGAPGIFSSRYSEEGSDISNTDKLLRKMSGIKTIHRTARFRCSLVLVYKNNKNPISVEGLVEGKIAREKKGNKGFVFISYCLSLVASKQRRLMKPLRSGLETLGAGPCGGVIPSLRTTLASIRW